jgi:hypothetical protein
MINVQLQEEAPYFIELLGRHDEVKMRHRFDQLPITIGRGYANDLILDDTGVANYHAIVDESGSGALSIRELGSRQGLVHKGKRVSAIVVDGDSIVKLGSTQVRIRSASYVEDHLSNKAKLMFDGILSAVAGLMMLIFSSLLSIWLASTDKFSVVSYLFALAIVLGLVLLWSGCWAFANRVISGRARFFRHFFIVSFALIIIDLWEMISSLIAYTFSLEIITAYANHATMLIVAIMVFFHLTTISDQHRKRFIGITALLTIIGSGLILLSNYQRSGNFSDELYMSHLLPPELRQSQNLPVDEFINDAKQLKGKLDKARLNKVDNSGAMLGQNYQQ